MPAAALVTGSRRSLRGRRPRSRSFTSALRSPAGDGSPEPAGLSCHHCAAGTRSRRAEYPFILFARVGFSRRKRLALLVALALGLAAAIAFESSRTDDARPTLAELAAHNYRTLSRHDSRLLVRFAEREYRCLASKGSNVSAPVVSRTRITMRAPGKLARSLARLQLACDPQVGPPPVKAALQARDGQVLVYLPKRCLIDPSELS